jgi:hypothetical protein
MNTEIPWITLGLNVSCNLFGRNEIQTWFGSGAMNEKTGMKIVLSFLTNLVSFHSAIQSCVVNQ